MTEANSRSYYFKFRAHTADDVQARQSHINNDETSNQNPSKGLLTPAFIPVIDPLKTPPDCPNFSSFQPESKIKISEMYRDEDNLGLGRKKGICARLVVPKFSQKSLHRMYNESFELNSSENMHKEFNPHNYFALKYQEIKKNFKNLDFKLKRRNNRLGLGNIRAPEEGMTRDFNKKLGHRKQFLDQNGHMSVRNSLAQRKTQGSNMRRIMHRDQSDMPSRDFYKYTVSRSKKQGSFWNKAQKQNILPKVSVDKTSEDQKEPKEDFRNIKNTLDKHHRNYKGSNKASYLGRKFNNLEKRLGHLLTNPGLNSSFEPKDSK
ncbi:unnamed protein product [Moneuplotes crassus]|uniref:Uncharacterized protein n=1 Tax=Euplotes crassus TaxID=5936 RepID=A0AAD1U513_EUPCR|nr:unnamed protein product [Moneuplotes crassus]